MACEVGEKIPLIASQNVFENVEQFKTLFKAVFFASVASASVGFSIGYTSYYNHEDGNIIDEIFFAILLAIGAVFGLVFGVIIIERFGRIAGIMIASIFYIPGWIIIGVCPYGVVIFGRFLTGVATGFCSLTVPIYIVEVSFCRVRGSLMVINQIGLTIGILLASILGYLDNKKIIAGAAVTNAVLMRILVQFIPESPRWLLTKKKRSEALKALLWLRGPLYDIEDECSYIENNLEQQPIAALNDFKKPAFYRPLVYSSMLMIFQQMCGINPLLFFGQRLFKKSGISFLIIPLYVTHLLSTVIMCFIVDKFGRRKLLMLGALGMLLCNSLLGVYLQLFIIPNYNEYYKNINLFDEDIRVLEPFNVKYDPKYSLLAFLCFFLFILCYSIGWGPLPYLFMSELFPPRLRGLSCSTVLIVNWVFSLIATASFFIPPLEVDIVTWIFCVFCLISIFFVYFFVPETKDKTLEEIEHYYQMNQQWLNYLF